MSEPIARRGFLLRLLGLAGAGSAAGLAIGRTLKAERQAASPVLCFNGRYWHTHETIDHLAGSWDIRWCYAQDCEHTVEQIGTTRDGYRIWHLKNFNKPAGPGPGDVRPGAFDGTPPLRRYFLDHEG